MEKNYLKTLKEGAALVISLVEEVESLTEQLAASRQRAKDSLDTFQKITRRESV